MPHASTPVRRVATRGFAPKVFVERGCGRPLRGVSLLGAAAGSGGPACARIDSGRPRKAHAGGGELSAHTPNLFVRHTRTPPFATRVQNSASRSVAGPTLIVASAAVSYRAGRRIGEGERRPTG